MRLRMNTYLINGLLVTVSWHHPDLRGTRAGGLESDGRVVDKDRRKVVCAFLLRQDLRRSRTKLDNLQMGGFC
jgi:hypothetical protein